MSKHVYLPEQVIPQKLSEAVADLPYWFVIGGHCVRCFCPYRPTNDVDFGVRQPKDLKDLIAQLSKSGKTKILEQSKDTVHLTWNNINVSIFVLENLFPYVENRRLNTTGILGTKLHAILDRGTRRDFFDLYVTLQHHKIGIAECLSAMREVYKQELNEALLLRSLTYFEDAEREVALSKEGPEDWNIVKIFFLTRVGNLLIPPTKELDIQACCVDVRKNNKKH